MKKMIIVSCSQFGYHTDFFKHSQTLKNEYEITYICCFQGHKKIDRQGINVEYIYSSSRVKFIVEVCKKIKKVSVDVILVDYFIGSSILKIFNWKEKLILDFRTGAVDTNVMKRNIKNILMIAESKIYPNISVISEGLRERLYIDGKKSQIISLGASRSVSEKNIEYKFDTENINLIYVGVFTGRRIIETVVGYHKYLKYKNYKVKSKYSIIGYGEGEKEIQDYIKNNKIDKYVQFYGRLHNEDLIEFFEESNVGVSYIPINYQYDVQPPTKTYEYMMNGLACIGTKTMENKKIINEKNGIAIEDNSEAVFEGLKILEKNLKRYNKFEIAESVKENEWDNITKKLKVFIEKVCDKSEK